MKYRLLNIVTGEIVNMSLNEILKEINRDRSDNWRDYNKTDWKEGLEVFTKYKILNEEL